LLSYITGAAVATFGFARRLAVRTDVFLGFGAPENPIVILPPVIHGFAAEIAAGKLEVSCGFCAVFHR